MALRRALAAGTAARWRPRAPAAPTMWGPAAGRAFGQLASAGAAPAASPQPFVFTPDNFRKPQLPAGLTVVDVPIEPATDESLSGFGVLVRNPDDYTVAGRTFEITPWP